MMFSPEGSSFKLKDGTLVGFSVGGGPCCSGTYDLRIFGPAPTRAHFGMGFESKKGIETGYDQLKAFARFLEDEVLKALFAGKQTDDIVEIDLRGQPLTLSSHELVRLLEITKMIIEKHPPKVY